MVINERKEIVHKEVEDVPVGRVCDACGKEIKPIWFVKQYNYFVVHTYHNDWANDSCESHEYFDACSPECATKMAEAYLKRAFNGINTMSIEIEHTRCLSNGTIRTHPCKIEGWPE